MAFNSIAFNRSSGVGEGINAAAENFLRAYQLRQQRKLQQQQADTQQQQATLQTQAMQREAQMAPLREALIRGQAFQQGIKPADVASDTTFNLPTVNTVGAPVVSAPALTVGKDQRFVPLGGGTLPIASVSDATQPVLQEQGGFVFDTMDNPTARATNAQAAENAARVESAREQARQALQMLYTREGLASERQSSQNQFTARQNELNRANQRDMVGIRAQQAAATQGTANLPKPQEFNMKAALVAPRAIAAAQQIDDLGNPQSSLPARTMQHVPLVGQFFTSDQQQQLQQAGETLATAVLRLESGAAVSEQEARRYAAQFLPQPGDSEGVLAQKAENRRIAVERLKAAAAPVTEREQGAQPAATAVAPTASAAPGNRNTALARAMALRLKAQGLSDEQIVASLRENGFEVEP